MTEHWSKAFSAGQRPHLFKMQMIAVQMTVCHNQTMAIGCFFRNFPQKTFSHCTLKKRFHFHDAIPILRKLLHFLLSENTYNFHFLRIKKPLFHHDIPSFLVSVLSFAFFHRDHSWNSVGCLKIPETFPLKNFQFVHWNIKWCSRFLKTLKHRLFCHWGKHCWIDCFQNTQTWHFLSHEEKIPFLFHLSLQFLALCFSWHMPKIALKYRDFCLVQIH